jgi:amino acid permease
LVAAGSVHAAKATARPVVTIGTAGMFNPIVSVGEDVIATIASLVAIFLPALVLVVLAAFVFFVAWAVIRRRSAPPAPDRGF